MDNITIKLYPIEYGFLYGFLNGNNQTVSLMGLNSHISNLVMDQFYVRKGVNIKQNATSYTKKPRRLVLKPLEAKALYDSLRLIDYPVAKVIFGHLDRALINAGFNNLSC